MPTPADPAAFARSQRLVFDGHNLHVGNSDVVHAVDWAPWINGHTLPAPACRQGFAGHGAHGELRPTRHPVSCRRCRRLHNIPDNTDQPALFPLYMPANPALPE